MIYSTVLVLLGAYLAYGVYVRIAALRANMALAKATGFPYYWRRKLKNVLSHLSKYSPLIIFQQLEMALWHT